MEFVDDQRFYQDKINQTMDEKAEPYSMCFDRFLLAFESRDLSQADKRIRRVSPFPSFNILMIYYNYTQKSYLAI